MPRVTFRFYAELIDHLPAYRRQVSFDWDVPNGTTAEAAFTCLGVPASEIDLLLVNGESVGLGQCLHEGDRVSVYPTLDAERTARGCVDTCSRSFLFRERGRVYRDVQ